jgi:hypothetical protein
MNGKKGSKGIDGSGSRKRKERKGIGINFGPPKI